MCLFNHPPVWADQIAQRCPGAWAPGVAYRLRDTPRMWRIDGVGGVITGNISLEPRGPSLVMHDPSYDTKVLFRKIRRVSVTCQLGGPSPKIKIWLTRWNSQKGEG